MSKIEHSKEAQEKIDSIAILQAKPLLSKKEYRELYGVSVPTIDRLLKAGQIRYIKIGVSVRIINPIAGDQ
jgi:excisionase family DNA binding protein